jgi:organic hydroperoxide reductase OsmC/OhrA
MSLQGVAEAMQRVEAVLRRRPAVGIHDDAPATARWTGGTRVVASHANGTQVPTDMPTEIGGAGDCVTPGWLFRAGLAACAATSIVLAAAGQGVELSLLETCAGSRSDTRGILGMAGEDGQPVRPGPGSIDLNVRIAAPGVEPSRLRELVELGCRRSPIPAAVRDGVALNMRVDVVAG